MSPALADGFFTTSTTWETLQVEIGFQRSRRKGPQKWVRQRLEDLGESLESLAGSSGPEAREQCSREKRRVQGALVPSTQGI